MGGIGGEGRQGSIPGGEGGGALLKVGLLCVKRVI